MATTTVPQIEVPLRPTGPHKLRHERKRMSQFAPRRSYQDLSTAGKTGESGNSLQQPGGENGEGPSPDRPAAGYGFEHLRIRDEQSPRSPSPRFSLPKSPLAKPSAQSPLQRMQRPSIRTPTTSPETSISSDSAKLHVAKPEPVTPTILIGIDFGTT